MDYAAWLLVMEIDVVSVGRKTKRIGGDRDGGQRYREVADYGR